MSLSSFIEYVEGLFFSKDGGENEDVVLGPTFEDRLSCVDAKTLSDFVPCDVLFMAATMNGGVAQMIAGGLERQEHRVNLTNVEILRYITSTCGLNTEKSLLDIHYVGVNEKWLLRAATWLSVDFMGYAKDDGTELDEGEIGDCDEFGVALSGLIELLDGRLAFGRARGDIGFGYHYFNVFVNEKRELMYIEPQTNRIKKLKDVLRKEGTFVRSIEM